MERVRHVAERLRELECERFLVGLRRFTVHRPRQRPVSIRCDGVRSGPAGIRALRLDGQDLMVGAGCARDESDTTGERGGEDETAGHDASP